MVFQDPFAWLDPMYRVGDQIAEAVLRAFGRKAGACARAGRRDARHVGIPNRKARAHDTRTVLGGMRQRAMIAMASCTTERS